MGGRARAWGMDAGDGKDRHFRGEPGGGRETDGADLPGAGAAWVRGGAEYDRAERTEEGDTETPSSIDGVSVSHFQGTG